MEKINRETLLAKFHDRIGNLLYSNYGTLLDAGSTTGWLYYCIPDRYGEYHGQIGAEPEGSFYDRYSLCGVWPKGAIYLGCFKPFPPKDQWKYHSADEDYSEYDLIFNMADEPIPEDYEEYQKRAE